MAHRQFLPFLCCLSPTDSCAEAGWHLQGLSIPVAQGRDAQDCIQLGFEYLQQWRPHNLSAIRTSKLDI